MNDQSFQEKFDQAWTNQKKGKFTDAMKLYDELYEQLIKEAADYARSFDRSEIDEGDAKKGMPLFFIKAEEYSKRDNRVCTILNNVGVIFTETGDKESAIKYFKESIKFTPDGLDYQNPKIGLKELE